MKRYIDADKLKAEIERLIRNLRGIAVDYPMLAQTMRLSFEGLLSFIDSLQQDDTQVDKMLCSQVWWEEQGWIMIPPDATIEGIDSLLKQIRKKLQQDQSEVGLEKFTQKMDDWKSRYNYPDSISVKATMAFTARMFYMYPDIAREWYNGLPKATQDQL